LQGSSIVSTFSIVGFSFITYCGLLIYLRLYTYSIKDAQLIKYILYVIAFTVTVLTLTILTLCLITYFRTGKLIVLNDIIFAQTSFYGDGFYMIRMGPIHPWLMLIGIYLVSLVKALRDLSFLRSGAPIYSQTQSAFFFLMPVLGIGLFSYYQGRSHDFVLPAVMWPAIVILVLFAQEYADSIWQKSNQGKEAYKILVRENAFPIIKLILSGLIISFIATSFFVNMLDNTRLTYVKEMATRTVKDVKIDEALRLYDYYISDGYSVDLIMEYSASIYCLRNDTTIPNLPATVDLFTKNDDAKCMNYLKKTNNVVIFDEYTFDTLQKYSKTKFDTYFLSRYTLKESSNLYRVYAPRFML